MDKKLLISDEYLKLQVALHDGPRGYGNSGRKHAGELIAVGAAMNLTTLLDYGAGGGTLKHALQMADWPGEIREYDPAIAGISDLPTQNADLVTCTDVLEHIEPDRIDRVLGHICVLTKVAAFLVISTIPSSKVLRDGRNAHLIVQTPDWWEDRVLHHGFTLQSKFVRFNQLGASEVVLWVTR